MGKNSAWREKFTLVPGAVYVGKDDFLEHDICQWIADKDIDDEGQELKEKTDCPNFFRCDVFFVGVQERCPVGSGWSKIGDIDRHGHNGGDSDAVITAGVGNGEEYRHHHIAEGAVVEEAGKDHCQCNDDRHEDELTVTAEDWRKGWS